MKLYSYFRSSAAFRVRIALALKGMSYQYLPLHLPDGAQRDPAYLALNPQGLTPLLETEDGVLIPQSLAIIEYLEEIQPQPPLLPGSPEERARIRSLACIIACDLHPLNNLRVQRYLADPLGHDQATVLRWVRRWAMSECAAVEHRLSRDPQTGACCHGDAPTMADLCLVPQVFNNERFGVDMTPYPTIARIHRHCMALPAFQRAAPAVQPDAM